MALVLVAGQAAANDFGLNEGAYGPEPLDLRRGDESPLRLAEETLVFLFSRYHTTVVAQFRFQNTRTDSAVHQLSGFPDTYTAQYVERPDVDRRASLLGGDGDLPNTMGPLETMRTFLDGEPVESTLRYGYVQADTTEGYFLWVPATPESGRYVAWHTVPLTVPPGGDLRLERRYTTTNGVDGVAGQHFYYITLTGSAWKGTIGKLTARVILEDSLTVRDLDWVPGQHDGRVYTQPPAMDWVIESPTSMRLEWRNFEPMREPNRQVIVVAWRTYPSGEDEEEARRHAPTPPSK